MFSKLSWRFYLVIGAMALAFGPMLFFYFRQQWSRPEYQAFPLVIAAVLYLLHARIGEARAVDRCGTLVNFLGGVCLASGLGILFLSYWVFSPWLAMGGFMVANLAIAAKIWQYRAVAGLWGGWACQFLMLPPPVDRDQLLIGAMQRYSSRLTSVVLESLGVMHLMQGNTLTFSDRDFFVAEACSGIVSLISILSIVAIYCLWCRFRIGATLFLLLCGGVWAVLMNTVRLTAIALAWYHFQVDLAEGASHMFLALGVFLLSILVLQVMAKFASACFEPIPEFDLRQTTRHVPWMIRIWNRWIANPTSDETAHHGLARRAGISSDADSTFFHRLSFLGPPTMLATAVLGIGLAAIFVPFENKHAATIQSSMKRALAISEDFAWPSDEFQLISFSNERRDLFRWDRWGQHSRTFYFSDKDNRRYVVSCDFMFGPHWHDLRECYWGSGWQIDEESVVFEQDLGKQLAGREVVDSLIPDWTIERFRIYGRDASEVGFVVLAAFRGDGQAINRPRGSGWFGNFWSHLVQGRDRAEQADYFQVQVSTFGRTELVPPQKVAAENLLKLALVRFREEIAEERNMSGVGQRTVQN